MLHALVDGAAENLPATAVASRERLLSGWKHSNAVRFVFKSVLGQTRCMLQAYATVSWSSAGPAFRLHADCAGVGGESQFRASRMLPSCGTAPLLDDKFVERL